MLKTQAGDSADPSSLTFSKQDVTIQLLKEDFSAVTKVWKLTGCFIKGYKLSDFDASGSDVVFESIVLSVDTVEEGS